jgi:hypothetical protein
MQPLRAFCIASTISLNFLRRKGVIIILSSLHQSNVLQPPFQNLECFLCSVLKDEGLLVCQAASVCLYVWFCFLLHNCSIITSSFFRHFLIHAWCANLVWFIYLSEAHSVLTNERLTCEMYLSNLMMQFFIAFSTGCYYIYLSFIHFRRLRSIGEFAFFI